MDEAVTADDTWLEEAISQELGALSGASEQELAHLISRDTDKLREEYSRSTESLDEPLTSGSEQPSQTLDPDSYLKLLDKRSEEHVDYLNECTQFLEQCSDATAHTYDAGDQLSGRTAEPSDSTLAGGRQYSQSPSTVPLCQDDAASAGSLSPGDTRISPNSHVEDGESLFIVDFEESLRKRDAELAEMEQNLRDWEDGTPSGSPAYHADSVLPGEKERLRRLEAELEGERATNARIQADLRERTLCRQQESCTRIQAAYKGYRCRKVWRPLIARNQERKREEEERAAAECQRRIQREMEDKRRQAEQLRRREAAEQQQLREEHERKRIEEAKRLHRQEIDRQESIAEELRIAEHQHAAREEQRRKEAETKRLAEDLAEKQKAEDAERLCLEKEARQKSLAAEAEKRRVEEEVKRCREAEEEQRRRKEELEMVAATEEAERQRLENTELLRRKRLEEEEEARQRCEEQRRQEEAEEEERVRQMAEEELLKRQLEEMELDDNIMRHRERRLRLETRAAVRIQAVVRGFLLRARLYKALCAAQSLTDVQGGAEDSDDDFDYDQEIDMMDFEYDEDQMKFEFDAKEMEALTPLPQRDILPPLSPAAQHPSLVSSGVSSCLPPPPPPPTHSSPPVSSHRKVILPPINRPMCTTATPDLPTADSAAASYLTATSERTGRMEVAVADGSAPKPRDNQLAEQVAVDWGFNNTATVSLMRRRALRFQGKKKKSPQPQQTTEYHWKEYPQRRKKKKKMPRPAAGVEDLFSKVKLKSSSMATSSVSSIALPQIDIGLLAGDSRLMAQAQRLCSSSTSEIISSGSYPLLHSMKAWENAGKSGQHLSAPSKKR